MLEIGTYKEALVRIGANKVAHQEGTLLGHLENTFRILEEMKCAEHVCLAGLFHGAYGTQALHAEKIEALPDGQREEVQALIGDKAERLVFNFSVMSYESLGRSVRNVLRPGGQPALHDRRTGEALPMTPEEFDELLQLKLADVLAHVPIRHMETQLDLPADYGSFWQIVAEHLGPRAIDTWNGVLGDSLWIQLEQ